jgi:uncharacterized membrane protein
MRTKILAAGLMAILLASTTSATTISDEKVTVDLEDSHVTVEMDIEDLTTETFNYQTTHSVEGLEAYFNGNSSSCNVNDLTVGAEITCDTDLKNNFSVRLEYTTSGLVNTQNEVQIFSYSQPIYRPIDNYTFRVLLPEGTGLVDQSNTTTSVIQPENGRTGNLGGRRFFVEWKSNPELGEPQRFQVVYETLEDDTSSDLIPAILGILLLAGIAYVVYRRKGEVQASSVLDELSEDQEKVVELLRENEGEILQKDIVEESEYSKAKISGVVKELEEKDIISKEKEGRSNLVKLKNKFMD